LNPTVTKALLVFFLPLSNFILLLFSGQKLKDIKTYYATFVLFVCFILSITIFQDITTQGTLLVKVPWLSISSEQTFYLGIQIDFLSALMLLIVTFVSSLVHLFSIKYMQGDQNIVKYYAYIGLFTFSMVGILFSTSLLMLFVFWELVGLSSYLLIGFWYHKASAVAANKKAFITNRVGDAGFLAGILVLYSYAGTLDFASLLQYFQTAHDIPSVWMFVLGIGLFLGCVGKSAQFPLQIWLPDAMEGPTPVSALIHAATMVAAGIFLLARVFFMLSPDVLTCIAYVGAITALMGAVAACTQFDIKKVLAYSTISQLGYMVMAMGVGSYQASFFHLVTHAFFKACLFLASGAIIHAMHHVAYETDTHVDAQDMRFMGGLAKKMPITFVCYLIATSSLVGIPLFSGFLSKDAILLHSMAFGIAQPTHVLIPILGFVSVFFTAFYMLRQVILVFFGEFRLSEHLNISCLDKVKEAPVIMRIPLIFLAILSFFFVFSFNPLHADHGWLMEALNTSFTSIGGKLVDHHQLSIYAILTSLALAIVGLSFAWKKFNPKRNELSVLIASDKNKAFFYRLSHQNWFLDRFYLGKLVPAQLAISKLFATIDQRVIDYIVDAKAKVQVVFAALISFFDKWGIDGLVNLLAQLVKSVGKIAAVSKTGRIQNYLIGTFVGILLIAVFLLWF